MRLWEVFQESLDFGLSGRAYVVRDPEGIARGTFPATCAGHAEALNHAVRLASKVARARSRRRSR